MSISDQINKWKRDLATEHVQKETQIKYIKSAWKVNTLMKQADWYKGQDIPEWKDVFEPITDYFLEKVILYQNQKEPEVEALLNTDERIIEYGLYIINGKEPPSIDDLFSNKKI